MWYWLVLFLLAPGAAQGVELGVDAARAYIAETSTPGYTMQRQTVAVAVSCLHPRFAVALAAAIIEARASELPDAGVYSACRPPVLGVGGFSDKHASLHAYGLAVDMIGIGRPGSTESERWAHIAGRHGLVNPYGHKHSKEWNHWQASPIVGVRKSQPLRQTITKNGPIELENTWKVAQTLLTMALGGTLSDAPSAISKKLKSKKKKKPKAKKSKKKKQKYKKRKKRR
jgi:hypothetical protein